MNATLRRFSAIIVFALIAAFTATSLAAEEPKREDTLLIRYFWIPSSLFQGVDGVDGEEDKLPVILDGLEDNAVTRTSNARKYLEANGVAFPKGAAAIYYKQAGLLGIKNTAENIRNVARMVATNGGSEPRQMLVEARVMEYTPDVETKLSGRSTFAELEAKLGKSVKTVCAVSVLTPSGQRATGRVDVGISKTNSALKQKQNVTKDGAQDSREEWPPPLGVGRALFEVEGTTMPTLQRGVDYGSMRISFRFAAPADVGRPAMRAEVVTEFSINDGCLLVVKTFTVSDPSREPNLRHYAVIVAFKKQNREGKTTEQLREEIAKKGEGLKKQ